MSEHTFKILVTGPFAAGKTSLIQSISQTPVVTTEVATTGDESAIKANTTVAMDFGTFTLGADALGDDDDIDDLVATDEVDSITLLLFGTPGQERFRFMTDVLKSDVDIVTFVVDARAPAAYQEARGMLALVMSDLQVPMVVAVNRCDDPDQARAVATYLGVSSTVPAVPCQLVNPDSGREVVAEVLAALLQSTDLALVSQGGAS